MLRLITRIWTDVGTSDTDKLRLRHVVGMGVLVSIVLSLAALTAIHLGWKTSGSPYASAWLAGWFVTLALALKPFGSTIVESYRAGLFRMGDLRYTTWRLRALYGIIVMSIVSTVLPMKGINGAMAFFPMGILLGIGSLKLLEKIDDMLADAQGMKMPTLPKLRIPKLTLNKPLMKLRLNTKPALGKAPESTKEGTDAEYISVLETHILELESELKVEDMKYTAAIDFLKNSTEWREALEKENRALEARVSSLMAKSESESDSTAELVVPAQADCESELDDRHIEAAPIVEELKLNRYDRLVVPKDFLK